MIATHPNAQIRQAQPKLSPLGRFFSHAEACRLFAQALRLSAEEVVIDLARVEEATTSAFAELVLLRRMLLRSGRDLCVTGMHDRTAGLFEVNRLSAVLPTL